MTLFITLLTYLLFLWWYQGVGKRVSLSEVDGLMSKLESITREHHGFNEELLQAVKKFLTEDDGKDFVMINLMKFSEPNSESQKTMNRYSIPFLRRLLFRAGHPVFYSKVLANDIERWGLPQGSENWAVIVGVRYRNRRDLIDMLLWPKFYDFHPLKREALEKTISLPASAAFFSATVKMVFLLMLVLVWLLFDVQI